MRQLGLLLAIMVTAAGCSTGFARQQALSVPHESRAKAEWEAAVKQLEPALVPDGPIEQIDHLRGLTPPHVTPGPRTLSGWDEHCGGYEITVFNLDAVWSLVEERAGIPGHGHLDDPADARRLGWSVAGLPDIKGQVPAGLYDAVAAVHASPAVDTYDFDPVNLVRAVNTLQAMGKDQALAAVSAYLQICEDNPCRLELGLDPGRVFLILRLLFVRQDGGRAMPEMQIGAFGWHPGQNTKRWPLFPLTLEGGVPFLVSDVSELSGKPQSPSEHIEFCRNACRIIDRPLSPGLDPCAAADSLAHATRIGDLAPGTPPDDSLGHILRGGQSAPVATPEELVAALRRQAVRAASGLQGVNAELAAALENDDGVEAWDRYASAIAALHPVWDAERQEFVPRTLRVTAPPPK